MSRNRTRINWLYDNDLQHFTTPAGQVVPLLQIAQLLQDQVECRHDFAGAWVGWRIRQNRLIPPGEAFRQSQITPNNLRAFARWLRSFEGEQAQLEFHNETPGRQMTLAPSSHASVDRDSPSSTEPLLLIPAAKEDRQPGSNRHLDAPYEPRRRTKVVQMADYRKQVR